MSQRKTNMAALELMQRLGVCYAPWVPDKTAWHLKHKIMQAMTERESDRQLGGMAQGHPVVLIDDAYLAGERNGSKAARGSENKVLFVVALEVSDQWHSLQAVITPVPGFTLTALADWAKRHLRPETDVYCDGLGAFGAAIEEGYVQMVVTSAGGRHATEAGGICWLNKC